VRNGCVEPEASASNAARVLWAVLESVSPYEVVVVPNRVALPESTA